MKKILLIFLGLIFLNGCMEEKSHLEKEKGAFNFGALEKYFEIVDELKVKGVIDSIKWSAFLEEEGNKLYVKENGMSSDFTGDLKVMLEQVYNSPDSLNEKRKEDIEYASRLRYKEEENNFREHMNWLRNNQSTFKDSIISRTKQFLPKEQKLRDTFPPIYYHALDFDGSANDKGIFVSIMSSYDNNKRRLGNFEAHELHHLYRNSILDKKEIEEKDKGVIWAIEAALNEGIANMVDKDVMLSEASDWWLKDYVVQHYEENGKKGLIGLNKFILDELNDIHHSENEYRKLFYGTVGHIPGYYMANAIKEAGSLEELIEISDNPFKFCMLYNEAAINSKETVPIFDKKVINYIQQLMEKYSK